VAGFYRDVLGLPEVARHAHEAGRLRSIWIGIGDGFLAIEQAPQESDGKLAAGERPGYHLLALRIAPEERRGFEEALARRGVPLERESRWTLYVRDPEGNRVGLSHHPHD
jgi:catechol 2,3-dioxygenase-like lactoylglutathione lyase family enzyme